MKKINILVLTVILAIILFAAEIIILKSVSKYEPAASVVFAARKITAGETFTEDMLGVKEMSVEAVHSKSIRNKSELIGKIAKTDIEKDEVILSSRAAISENAGQIEVIDKNNRLITVEFKTDQANGWQLKEGQYVDIIFIPGDKNDTTAVSWVTAMNESGSGDDAQNYPQKAGQNSGQNDGQNNEQNDGQSGGIIQCITSTGIPGIYRISNVRVAALIGENGKLARDSDKSGVIPRYITFEVNNRLDEFLAYAKSSGRLELSVVPPKE